MISGVANFAGDPSNKREQSVYADPMPKPAPKATDAQRVTGVPSITNQNTLIKIINLKGANTINSAKALISLCQG
jgi:hypothetical protein